MARLKQAIIRSGLEAMYFSGAHKVLRPLVGGIGAILTLHHVRPHRLDGFQPNRLLEVTPEFLQRVVTLLRQSRVDLVSLDDMHRRLLSGGEGRRFACLTIDDGYRDVLEFAYPILRQHEVPFAVYVATSFADRLGELWWLALEAVIARNDHLVFATDGTERHFDCRTVEEKRNTYDVLYAWLRGRKSEDELRQAIRELCASHEVDIGAFCRELCMSWPELEQFAADPLVTIGAHTVNHVMLAKVPEPAARTEIATSRRVIEATLGVPVDHVAYPIGDRTAAGPREFSMAAELGFKTGVTTRPGMLFPEHRQHLTALPRISLNGDFQQLRYVEVLLSGSATAVWNGFRRVNAA